MNKHNLSKQFISIVILIFIILFIAIGYLLPRVLLPIHEQNIYTILYQPLTYIDQTLTSGTNNNEIGYILIKDEEIFNINTDKIIKLNAEQIIELIEKEEGNFTYKGRKYYYIQEKNQKTTRIAITNDKYINKIKGKIINNIYVVLFFTMLIVIGIMMLWSQLLISRIAYLKQKIDNLDSDVYPSKNTIVIDDELESLSKAIDSMRHTLKEQDEYKNQMYQNISHDFKTPLTVMKSHIEGIDDGMIDTTKGLKIIKEQIQKLEQKVYSLLYLNKLNYIKEQNNFRFEKTDVRRVINASVDKMKVIRPEIKWTINTPSKCYFRGTFDMWEAIIDNLLGNFIRYAKDEIKITIKNNKIYLSNDGPNIDMDILNDIFTPYKKGIKGQFGLGLSIVKKTVKLMGYEINVSNEKNGVNFIIK